MLLYLLSTVKAKPVDKMKQSTYLCVILHVKPKKLPILSVLTWFLILGKIQDGGQGGYHVWWRHRSEAATLPIKYSLSCWEDQSLFDESKAFSKYWCTLTYQKLKGGVPLIKPPPPHHPPCTTVGVWLCVYVRGLRGNQMVYLWNKRIMSLSFCPKKAREIGRIWTKRAWNYSLISLVPIWLHI